MRIEVLFFATLKDIANTRRIELEFTGDECSINDVRDTLTEKMPNVQANLEAAVAAINEEFAQSSDLVHDGDRVAFFPPVSGGGDFPEYFLLASEPVNHDEIVREITITATGAICLFSGMVRGETQREGHLPQTEYLVYEAYEAMATAKMKQVADEIRTQFPLVQGIAIVQRIGKVGVGENTVLIACSAAHRNDGCFEAARYGIDRLKEIVPVWKKEVGKDGSSWIEGEYQPKLKDRS